MPNRVFWLTLQYLRPASIRWGDVWSVRGQHVPKVHKFVRLVPAILRCHGRPCPIHLLFIEVSNNINKVVWYSSVLSNPLRNKPQTVLIRVLTNYFQILMIVKNFDLSWPTQVQNALDVFSFITSSLELLVSFDCMMLKAGFIYPQSIDEDGYSSFYYKVIAYGVAPIFISFISAIAWSLIYLCKKKKAQRKFNLQRKITQTAFIVIYLLYPTITNLSFSLFNCVKLEDSQIYLKRDFLVKCWSPKHTQASIYIGGTMLSFWVIGFPLYIFMRLYQNRKRLNEKEVVLNYGLFFVGLDDHAYFWEIIVTNIRKVIFIVCGTILSSANGTVKVLIGMVIICCQSQFLNNYRPYMDPRFNSVEFHSQFAAIFTFFAGLFFVQEEIKSNNNILFLLFLMVLLYNVYFLTVWCQQFLNVILRIHYKTLQSIRYCRCLSGLRVDDYDKNLKRQKRKQRQIERNKKNDSILNGSKYVQLLGGGKRLALTLQKSKGTKCYAEDYLFHARYAHQTDKPQTSIASIFQGELKTNFGVEDSTFNLGPI